jgi:demethylmenaquinone methyltransferase/2-methoxy-6-polyprenyl-1,4-benzoquinol methylase
MLKSGLHKINSSVAPLAGDAFCLPLPERSIASITVSFGLRNMRPREEALGEMFRVLVPGGRLSVLEFGGTGKNRAAAFNPWFAAYRFYLFKALPRLGGIISGRREAYEYLAQSTAQFPGAEELKHELLNLGFERVVYKSLSGGIVYLHCADKKE